MGSQKASKIKAFLLQTRPDLIVLNSSGGFASRSTQNLLEKTLLNEIQQELQLQAELLRADRIGGALSDDEDDADKELPIYKAEVFFIYKTNCIGCFYLPIFRSF